VDQSTHYTRLCAGRGVDDGGRSVPIAEAQGSCDNLRMDEEDLIRAKGKTLHEFSEKLPLDWIYFTSPNVGMSDGAGSL